MTAIAGVVQDGEVWIGGDSAGVAGLALTVRADAKVFRLGEMVIGCAWSCRGRQILRYHVTPERPKEQQDPFEYFVTSLIPAIRRAMKDHGLMQVDNERENTRNHFMIGWRGRLFCVYSDLQVAESAWPFMALGCGDHLALGSLHSTEEYQHTPRERLTLALQAAEAFSAGVRGPFTILKAP